MRDIIKKQLQNCSYANLNNFNQETNTFFIPKYSKPKYELGKMYLIQVANNLVNNNNSVTATNWNNGTSPSFSYLKVYVSKALGKMIYVDSVGFNMDTRQDSNVYWSGWLPTESLTQISTVVM